MIWRAVVGTALFLAIAGSYFGRTLHENLLYDYAGPAVVKVSGIRSSGTAFYVKHKGEVRLLTAAHVCHNNSPMVLHHQDGDMLAIASRQDRINDICELVTLFSVLDPHALTLRPSPEERHQIVGTLGYAMGMPLTMYLGRTITKAEAQEIVGVPPCVKPQHLEKYLTFFGVQEVCVQPVLRLYTTAFTGPGHSGGVLLDFWGRARGMIVQVYTRPPFFSVVTPGEKLIEFLDAPRKP